MFHFDKFVRASQVRYLRYLPIDYSNNFLASGRAKRPRKRKEKGLDRSDDLRLLLRVGSICVEALVKNIVTHDIRVKQDGLIGICRRGLLVFG